MPELIRRKRDGGNLEAHEIESIIEQYTDGPMADYQMAALLMAILFKGQKYMREMELPSGS